MPRFVSLCAALGTALSTGACADLMALTRPDAAVTGAAAAPAGRSSAGSWRMPVQLTGGGAGGTEPTVAWVPGTGFVRGTPAVLARVGSPLPAAEGRNDTVEACRAVVEAEARKLGARSVEAVSAGPHTRDRQGRTAGSVLMRITYDRAGGYEVKEATLTCIVDRQGKIVDAWS